MCEGIGSWIYLKAIFFNCYTTIKLYYCKIVLKSVANPSICYFHESLIHAPIPSLTDFVLALTHYNNGLDAVLDVRNYKWIFARVITEMRSDCVLRER